MFGLKATDFGMHNIESRMILKETLYLIAMIFSFSGLQSENTSLKVENVDLTGV